MLLTIELLSAEKEKLSPDWRNTLELVNGTLDQMLAMINPSWM
ncbi:MAG: hypothetical protein WDN28_07795 [Chthoniobacter sp.]